jgi:hypothetical protein
MPILKMTPPGLFPPEGENEFEEDGGKGDLCTIPAAFSAIESIQPPPRHQNTIVSWCLSALVVKKEIRVPRSGSEKLSGQL